MLEFISAECEIILYDLGEIGRQWLLYSIRDSSMHMLLWLDRSYIECSIFNAKQDFPNNKLNPIDPITEVWESIKSLVIINKSLQKV